MSVPSASLSRPGDGTVMCCICFHYRTEPQLFTDQSGTTWDVCGEATNCTDMCCAGSPSCAEQAGLCS